MPWKMDESGKALVTDKDGNPIFVKDGGEEAPVNYPAMSAALARANSEAAERRTKLKDLEARLAPLADIEDIPAFLAAAKKDAETVKSLTDKEKDAEQATRARIDAAVAPLNQKIAELEKGKADAEARYHRTTIEGQFVGSKYVNEELVNVAMTQQLFASRFSVNDEGKIVGTDAKGEIIYDEQGVASFDNALRKMVAESPYKDFLVKGSPANGSGTTPGGNNPSNQQNSATREAVDKMTPVERAEFFRKGGTVR